jgi:thiosulfate/3-mercaptopyruvate sulfurtransferase
VFSVSGAVRLKKNLTNHLVLLYMNQWILSPNQAKQLISKSATILDTRNKLAWFLGHIPDAVHVTWQEFSEPEKPYRGNLLKDAKLLEQKLRQIGIFNSKPVIVIGNPAHNFGEEGAHCLDVTHFGT